MLLKIHYLTCMGNVFFFSGYLFNTHVESFLPLSIIVNISKTCMAAVKKT